MRPPPSAILIGRFRGRSGSYRPLLLDPAWWVQKGGAATGFDPSTAKHTADARKVVKNFECGAHDYLPTCELLVQSNPSLEPAIM